MTDLIDSILTKKRFSTAVEKFIREHRVPPMEAIIEVCERNGIDPADVGRLLSPSLKSKLEAEAMSLNLLPRGNQLPV